MLIQCQLEKCFQQNTMVNKGVLVLIHRRVVFFFFPPLIPNKDASFITFYLLF